MPNLEMIQVGTDVNDNPVYNVKNKEGGLYSTTIYTEDEAQALIDGVVATVAPVEVVVESVVTQTKETVVTPDYENMTKLELEATMRLHGIELDRRKSKKYLLSQVRKHFNK